MKKTWMNPEIAALDVKETAFGPSNDKHPDSEKTQVFDPVSGNLLGYRQEFGEAYTS